MNDGWAKPSISRDFALLTAAIIFLLLLISFWITYVTYAEHTRQVTNDLEKEAVRIEYRIDAEIERANYLLNAMGQQLVQGGTPDLVAIARMLKSFDNQGNIYSLFSWMSPEQKTVVSSNRGILDKPIDMSDRDYVSLALAEPWQMQIGRPIIGRLSERWVIPVGLGISDNTGKVLGLIMVSLDINTLSEQLSQLVRREGISFAVVSKNFITLTQVSNDQDFVSHQFPAEKLLSIDLTKSSSGLLSTGNLFWGTGNYSYYRVSNEYPYVILLGYDASFSDENVRRLLWSRLLELAAIASFLFMLLWIVRIRVIRPVLDMTHALERVAHGEAQVNVPRAGSVELMGLRQQIELVKSYITENRLSLEELRHKMLVLKQQKEQAERRAHSKSEYLAYIAQQLKAPVLNIVGFAQSLKDQLYGPLENRKYRQYAADIHMVGGQLLDSLQNVMLIGKADTHMVETQQKPIDVVQALQESHHFVIDRLRAREQQLQVVAPPSTLPQLLADEFQLQQIFSNLLACCMFYAPPGSTLRVQPRLTEGTADKAWLGIVFTQSDPARYTPPPCEKLLQRSQIAPEHVETQEQLLASSLRAEAPKINLDLVQELVHRMGGCIDIAALYENEVMLAVFFPPVRLQFSTSLD